MARHLLQLTDLEAAEVETLLAAALRVKQRSRGEYPPVLAGHTLALVFEKASARTRVSFEVAMNRLGGRTIYLGRDEIGLGSREAVSDVARVLSRYVDGIVARVYRHADLEELARWARVPVINGLSEKSHPCQALADLLTIKEKVKSWPEVRVAFVGDGNNVARSLARGCLMCGLDFTLAAPDGYGFGNNFLAEMRRDFGSGADRLRVVADPVKALAGAQVVYTDVWVSMGQEDEAERRRQAFKNYQVNAKLLRAAEKKAIVLHCLPARRGEEITDEVLDGPQSAVFDQAENRMHVQQVVLEMLLAPPPA